MTPPTHSLRQQYKNYLDHVFAVSDDNGNIDEHYRYTAFGEVEIYSNAGVKLSGSAIGNSVMWNSRRYDETTGLHYYKYRHYKADIGRWLGRDPIEETGGYNLYGFVGNEPFMRFDAFGLKYLLCILSNHCEGVTCPCSECEHDEPGMSAGHAFLALLDVDDKPSKLDKDDITTWGLWPDFYDNNSLDNGDASDIRENFKNDDVYGYRYRHCVEITDAQLKKLKEKLKENVEWTKTNNCASWASEVFEEVTGVDIDADDVLGGETPREVGESIVEANDGNDSNLDPAYGIPNINYGPVNDNGSSDK